ncbi:conserved hypothetical protein [delta proteobacterium NaphS2]|nr:conserved hypothetical protein [delta proteobacterium NaphS2]
MRKGFWESLSHIELLLYIFLVVVSDKNGCLITATTKSAGF